MSVPCAENDMLALDFDGVIADSIIECLIVGYNAYIDYSGLTEKIENLNIIEVKDIIKAKRMRNFIRSGEDYVYIQLAISKNIEITNQENFDDFLNNNHQLKETFFNLFYQERERFSTERTISWIQSNPLYSGMDRFLKEYSGNIPLCIISTKQAEYIHRILKGHHIPFPGKNIYHANQKRSKRIIIQELLHKYDVEPSHFHFVDDQVDTLIKVEPSGVHCYLAGWGYNNEEQKNRAVDAAIPILDLDDFYTSFPINS